MSAGARAAGLAGPIVLAVMAAATRADTREPPPRNVGVIDSITVTASRGAGRIATPGATTVVRAREILGRADATLDETLRGTPGFTLFRRAAASASNPTTQGVSLRGLTSSGASRALVLADGLPLNDPFGSWVAWDRVPLVAVDRVEIVRGATGDLYGPDALGGVVQILTVPPGAPRLRLLADGASRDAGRLSGLAQAGRGGWDGTLAGEWQRSPGFVTAAPEVRGPVDIPVALEYTNGFAGGGWRRGALLAQVRIAAGEEDRGNGTPLQVNDTRWRRVEAVLQGSLAGGLWQARGAGEDQRFHQTFSALAADRASERLTGVQRIPTEAGLASLQWSRELSRFAVLAGGEWRDVHATIAETRFPPGGGAIDTRSGGRARQGTGFLRARAGAFGPLTLVLGVRADAWRSHPYDPAAPERAATLWSPRASAELALARGWAIEAAAYRAWRTPTLNELHRGFRAGNVVTAPNPALAPERFTGGEIGVHVTGARAAARATAFAGVLDDAISNATVSVTPALVQRIRRNEDRLSSRGVELEAEAGPFARFVVRGFAVLGRARFERTPGEPELEGRRVPQVADWQAGGSFEWNDPSMLLLRADVRSSGPQYDDDLNQLRLAGFTVVDLALRRAVTGDLDAFVVAENVFDTRVEVARTPALALGAPRTWRAGLTFLRGPRP